MEGAYRLTTKPDDFDDYALAIPHDAEPTGTPHPFVVLKANQNLLSCSKRNSPVHSEVIDLDAPSKTIICTYDHQPRLLVGLRKPDGTSYVRTLLPDELKQIQGFPATYQLVGNTKELVTQIGNAVPPPLIECVATALKNYI
jgi:DNA (cytosine-5)-methyltransferase 1